MANVSKLDMLHKVDNASDQFAGVITKTEKAIFDSAVTLIKKLDVTSTGYIRTSTANIKLLSDIKTRLGKLTKSKEYLKGVKELAQAFDDIYRAQVAYYSSQFAKKTLSDNAKKKFAAMQRVAVANTIDGLTGAGINANVTDELSKMLLRAVTTGAKYTDLVDELRTKLISSKDGVSSLAKYANTYATTALTQYAGQNNKLFTDDLGCEWFEYVGSQIETTREFCNTILEHHQYIHVSEIKDILSGKITDQQTGEVIEVDLNPRTGLPKGMIEGTTPENFQVNVGGWNCRHQLVPIAKEVVPKEIRDRLEQSKQQKENPDSPFAMFMRHYKDRLNALRMMAKITNMELKVDDITRNKEERYFEYVEKYDIAEKQITTTYASFRLNYQNGLNMIQQIHDNAAAKQYSDIMIKAQQVLTRYTWNNVRTNEQYNREIDQIGRARLELQKLFNEQESLTQSPMGDTLKALTQWKIDYSEVRRLEKAFSEQEIIERLGGGDRTGGSCSSLALAYAGNKGGMDVLDFRGGNSREFFASRVNIGAICKEVGGKMAHNTNDYKSANELLQYVEEGKEYYFACAKHAAIVRKNGGVYEYLELQSNRENGFKRLTNDELKYRFGAKRSHTVYGQKLQLTSCLIDIELLYKNAEYQKVLGYINTAKDQQNKGIGGGKK